MQDSNIFIIYADEENNNVTLSPRLGTGDVQPQYDNSAKLTLLAGSGITNGEMVANALCSNCASWHGGTMPLNDPNSGWIWAWKQGDPISSNSLSANLEQHDDMGGLTFDLTKATGSADSTNPFVGAASSNSTSSTSSGDDSASSSDDEQKPPSYYHAVEIAHGTLLGACMVLLLPFGAVQRRFFPRSSIWVHAGLQMFNWGIAIAGMGMGIWMALESDQLITTHAYIGLVVICSMALQPIMGLMQHAHFRRAGTRGLWGWAHKFFGVGIILLGILNGGLGLQLSDNNAKAVIAYIVIASAFTFSWMVLIVVTSLSKHKVANGAWKNESPQW
jgi:Cytochrome domain of cellobiose dehydrogenase/Eukaryotic cytochrome b561